MSAGKYTPDHVRVEEIKGAILQRIDKVPGDTEDPGHIDRPLRKHELEAIYEELKL